MTTFLRMFVWLFVVVWVGGVLFFPGVAAVAFSALADKEQAGLIVRNCLLLLHTEGLISGAILLILLGAAAATRAFGRNVVGPLCCTLVMLALTAFSQFHVVPQMEKDRIAVGGDIQKAPNDPRSADFNHLHAASVQIEEGVLAAGVLMLGLLARAPRRVVLAQPGIPTYPARG